MQHIKEILKTRDWARRFIPAEGSMREKAAWTTKEDRQLFLVEQLKNSILSDYHALQDAIGKQAARSFILEEVDPVKYDHE